MRRFFRGKTSRGDRDRLINRLSEAILVLEKRRRSLASILVKLEERRESLRSKISAAKARNDNYRLGIYVAEYKEVEKLVKLIKAADLSFQRAALRLDSIKYYVAISGEITAAINAVKGVSDILQQLPSNLSKVTDEIFDTLHSLSNDLSFTEDKKVDVAALIEGKIDVEKIIDDAISEITSTMIYDQQDDLSNVLDVENILSAAKRAVVKGEKDLEENLEKVAPHANSK